MDEAAGEGQLRAGEVGARPDSPGSQHAGSDAHPPSAGGRGIRGLGYP